MCQKLRHLIVPPWILSFIFVSKGILFQTSHLGILWWNVYDAVSDLIHFLVGSSLCKISSTLVSNTFELHTFWSSFLGHFC